MRRMINRLENTVCGTEKEAYHGLIIQLHVRLWWTAFLPSPIWACRANVAVAIEIQLHQTHKFPLCAEDNLFALHNTLCANPAGRIKLALIVAAGLQ